VEQYKIELRTQDRIWETVEFQSEDLKGLRIEVARFVGEMLKDHAEKIWEDEDWRVDVTDDDGLILFILHLFVTDSPMIKPPTRPS
jgi:hypothetical protein